MLLHPVILAVPPCERMPRGRAQVAALSRLARRAVALSARRGGLRLESLEKDDAGAPLPRAGVFWSLSHKPRYVAGVAATSAVGIDLEALRPVSAGLIARIGGDGEWAILGGRTCADFFSLWTAKEAVLKAVGQGLAGLGGCRLEAVAATGAELLLRCAGRLWPVTHTAFDGHVAAITGRSAAVRWELG
jgi:4'-phosphopantetheinyl transferase